MHKTPPSNDPLKILTPEQLNARALVSKRRAAMRRRTRRIRQIVALTATTMFLGASGLIGVQLASGHDPALVADAKKAAVTTAAKTLVASTTTGTSKAAASKTATAETEKSAASTTSASTKEAATSSKATTSEGSKASTVTTSQS